MKFFRNLFAAFALAFPSFSRGKTNAADKANDAQERPDDHLVPGGTLEKVDKYYGKTIAGGPGSQKIGDTFNALPDEVKEEMLAARKGKIVFRPEGAWDDAPPPTHASTHDRLVRGLNRAANRVYGK